jgi:hypothetical protein
VEHLNDQTVRSPAGSVRVPHARKGEPDPDDDSQPRGWFIDKCGHPVPVLANGHVDGCECDLGAT